LNEIVEKKKKKVKESYINMMSYPHIQDAPSSKSMKRQKKKNPRDSLIHLQGFLTVSKLKLSLIME